MHHIRSQLFQCNGICQWFTTTLQGKWNIWVSNWESLTIDSHQGQTPVIRIGTCQLWYVRSIFAIRIALALPEDFLNVLRESQKVRYNQLMPESSSNEDDIRCNNSGIGIKMRSTSSGLKENDDQISKLLISKKIQGRFSKNFVITVKFSEFDRNFPNYFF